MERALAMKEGKDYEKLAEKNYKNQVHSYSHTAKRNTTIQDRLYGYLCRVRMDRLTHLGRGSKSPVIQKLPSNAKKRSETD